MKHPIKHRITGAVLFEAAIDCSDSAGAAVKLGLAVRAAVKARADLGGADLGGANLGGADLGGANLGGADLGGADLGGANLGRADLGRAYLGGADLGGAYLGGADLGGAYLGGANLGGADLGGADLIDAGQDRRGYRFVGQMRGGNLMVHAGCRYLTIEEAWEHWGEGYERGGDRLEIQAKLTLIEMTARSRGWLDDQASDSEPGRRGNDHT